MDARRLQSEKVAMGTRKDGSRRDVMMRSLVGAGKIEVRGARGVVPKKERLLIWSNIDDSCRHQLYWTSGAMRMFVLLGCKVMFESIGTHISYQFMKLPMETRERMRTMSSLS